MSGIVRVNWGQVKRWEGSLKLVLGLVSSENILKAERYGTLTFMLPHLTNHSSPLSFASLAERYSIYALL